MSFCIVASCTPCVGPVVAGVDQIPRDAASDTSSRSGQRDAAMRLRRSSRSSSRKLTVKGRIESSSVPASAVPIEVTGRTLTAAAAADTAKTLRREGVEDFSLMVSLPDVSERGELHASALRPLSNHWEGTLISKYEPDKPPVVTRTRATASN